MKQVLGIILLLGAGLAQGQQLSKADLDASLNKDLYLASGYQQQSYAQEDIQGDIALLGFARTNMKRIKLMATKDQEGLRELIRLQKDGFERYKSLYQQWDFNPKDPFPIDTTLTEARIASLPISQESKALLREKALDQNIGFELKSTPMRSTKFANALTQIIIEERQNGIEPTLGKEHNFSPLTYRYYRKEYPVLNTGMTKLFMALGNGLTFRFMVTEKEQALAKWIEAQPYESVSLADAFRVSYRLNDGDVYLTLLTLENLFAYHWTNPQRDRLTIIQRLKPFTHYFNRADKFGHWYHFWGMVLYGHVRGSMRASSVGLIEEGLSRLAGGEEDQENQEGKVNVIGGLAGGKLNRILRGRKYLTRESRPERTLESYYLEPMDLDAAIQKHFTK